MIYKTIKSHPNYKINILGDVINKTTGHSLGVWFNKNGLPAVCLSKNNKSTSLSLESLIIKHFYKKDPRKRSIRLREVRIGKLRGVIFCKTHKRYRAYLSSGKGKTKSLGYFETEVDARDMFAAAYLIKYGTSPY